MAPLGTSPGLLAVHLWCDAIDLADVGRLDPLVTALACGRLALDTIVHLGDEDGAWSRATALDELRRGRLRGARRDGAPAAELTLEEVRSFSGAPVALTGLVQLAGLGPAHVEALIELVRSVARIGTIRHGVAHPRADLALMGPALRGAKAPPAIHDPCWLMVLGSADVDAIGRDRVMAIPAHRVESLGDAVLIVATPTPLPVGGDAARRAQAAVLAHLDPDHDVDDVARRLSVRDAWAAVAAPPAAAVNPYDPDDLPPVPVEIVDDTDGWSPDATAPDFGLHAEKAVALTHTEVDTARLGCDDRAVAELDRFLLEHPRRWIDADPYDLATALAIAFGALVGEAMVQQLGGTWIPRAAPLAHGVRVGAQVFLPMLRAALATRLEPSAYYANPVRGHSLSHLFALARRAAAGERIPCAGAEATHRALSRYRQRAPTGMVLGEGPARAACFDAEGRLWTGWQDVAAGWEVPSCRPVARQDWNWLVEGIARDGGDLYTIDGIGTLRVWNVATGDRVDKAGFGRANPVSLVVDRGEAAWGQSKRVCAYRRGEGRVHVLDGHSSDVVGVGLTADEIVSVARERKLRRWARGNLEPRDSVPTGKRRAVSLAASGAAVALVLDDGLVVLFPDGAAGPRIEVGLAPGAQVRFDGAGRLVARVGDRITVRDPATGAEIAHRRLDAVPGEYDVVVPSPDLTWALHAPAGGHPRLLAIVDDVAPSPGNSG